MLIPACTTSELRALDNYLAYDQFDSQEGYLVSCPALVFLSITNVDFEGKRCARRRAIARPITPVQRWLVSFNKKTHKAYLLLPPSGLLPIPGSVRTIIKTRG